MSIIYVSFFTILDICSHFLKLNFVNCTAYAIHLGFIKDYEGIRLYSGNGELVARVLYKRNLVTIAETYYEACKKPTPNIKSFLDSIEPMCIESRSLLESPIIADGYEPILYTASSLDSECPVTVTSIQNGINEFTVRKISVEVERTRIQLYHQMSTFQVTLRAYLLKM